MSGTLMMVNPRKRRATKRKASPAQLAALARGRASRARATKPRRNPAPRAAVAMSNPRKRRRSVARRNPIGLSGGALMAQMMGAAQGAAGAVAVDIAIKYLPIPAAMKAGNMQHVTRAALAVGLGLLGRKFVGRAAGRMAEGALTVSAYGMLKNIVNSAGMKLAGADDMGQYMSEYVGYVEPAQLAYAESFEGVPEMSGGEFVPANSSFSF